MGLKYVILWYLKILGININTYLSKLIIDKHCKNKTNTESCIRSHLYFYQTNFKEDYF